MYFTLPIIKKLINKIMILKIIISINLIFFDYNIIFIYYYCKNKIEWREI